MNFAKFLQLCLSQFFLFDTAQKSKSDIFHRNAVDCRVVKPSDFVFGVAHGGNSPDKYTPGVEFPRSVDHKNFLSGEGALVIVVFILVVGNYGDVGLHPWRRETNRFAKRVGNKGEISGTNLETR